MPEIKKIWTWKDVKLPAEQADQIFQEFEVNLFRTALRHQPENVEILISLGDAFARRGMIQDGLEIDKRLVRVCPKEPTFYYNLACSHSLLNQVEPGLEALENAIRLGYKNLDNLQHDNDLDNLRKDRRFYEILEAVANR